MLRRMAETVTMRRRFRGPPESANGGYACGTVAGLVEGNRPVEATLRLPPPLETPLAAIRRDDGGAELRDGDVLVAEARPVERLDLEVPEAVDRDVADRASAGYPGFDQHDFLMCFVCGPDRSAGDGLRVFPGPIEDRDGFLACAWTPDRSLAGTDGAIDPRFVWSVLDCPGGNAAFHFDHGDAPAVLGRLAARLVAPVAVDEPVVVQGWLIGREGRKRHAGTAIFGAEGDLRACARAVWVDLRE